MVQAAKINKTVRGALLASVAVLAFSGTAHAGVISLTGHTVDGGTTTISIYNETDTGPLQSIDFDLSVDHTSPSWGSETSIELYHPNSGYSVTFNGDPDFGWGSVSGISNFAGSFLINDGPADIFGQWHIKMRDTFDDVFVNPDYEFLQSTVTLNAGDSVPEPGTLALIGLGLGYAGLRRRKKR